ncbi:MAG TPA: glutamate-cysteine ligase family protein, partial [Acidobacteriota bacterium]|nr:glutamate-cysteine ligase family protein [Acidobacteriota bacterium]
MGEQNIKFELEGEQLRVFTKALLNDLRALEYLIENNLIESEITRIGAEQELFLVDQSFQPAPVAIELLDLLKDDHYTTELAKFNLEINLDPLVFENRCFSVLEKQTLDLLNRIRQQGREIGVHPILVGILPTIRKADLELENLTPKPRYLALNRILNSIRGQEYEFYIRGVDELCVRHDSMMVESCNASFQVHLQVKAEEFPQRYNIAQALAAPVMAVSGNSPLLFGRRLWSETRIAVFRQSVDTRASSQFLRERSTRVTFGSQWVKNSITELYKEDISRFRPLIGGELDEDAMDVVLSGDIPKLKALKLHNGTVYRWNRACYGISEGKPHLRIENRVFPSGPTVVDEVANAAFWLGLMEGMPKHFPDVSQLMNFEDAKQNFYTAARLGMLSQFT